MGRVITPNCPKCKTKMKRCYVRPTGMRGIYQPIGFICSCEELICEWPPDVRKWMDGE